MDKYEIRRLSLLKIKNELCNGVGANLARRISREPSYVSRMLYPEGKKAKKRIADDMVEIIENAFDLPRGWLDGYAGNDLPITMENKRMKGFQIDVLDIEVSAGPGSLNNYFIEVLRSVEYSNHDALRLFGHREPSQLRIINIKGDSMSGTFESGDLLFIDISIRNYDGDGIYAFLYDDTAHVKRIQMMKDKLLVTSDNPNYGPWEPITKDEMNRVIIFGKVIGSMPQTFRKHG